MTAKSNKKVVLVHGIFDSGRVFSRFAKVLSANGYQPYAISLKPNYGSASLDELAKQLQRYIDHQFSVEEQVSLVGFSMGGIVSRYYLQRLGGLERVNKFIAISSPHYGTLTGYLTPLTGSKQMRPNSAFLKALNMDIARLEVLNPISIWTKYDQMIIPQKSAIMEVGESIHVHVFPHRLMSYSKKVSQLLVDYLP